MNVTFDHLFKQPLKATTTKNNPKDHQLNQMQHLNKCMFGKVSPSGLTAASTGTSCPARSLVSNGVMTIAPIVEHLYEFQEEVSKDHGIKFQST